MTPSLTIEEGLPPTGVFGDNKGSKRMHLQNKSTEVDNESLTSLKIITIVLQVVKINM